MGGTKNVRAHVCGGSEPNPPISPPPFLPVGSFSVHAQPLTYSAGIGAAAGVLPSTTFFNQIRIPSNTE